MSLCFTGYILRGLPRDKTHLSTSRPWLTDLCMAEFRYRLLICRTLRFPALVRILSELSFDKCGRAKLLTVTCFTELIVETKVVQLSVKFHIYHAILDHLSLWLRTAALQISGSHD